MRLRPARVKRVEARAPIVLGGPPFGLDMTLPIEAMQRLIERRVLDGEVAVRSLADERRDAVAVHRPLRQRAQHQHIQRALHEGQGRGGMAYYLPLDGVGSKVVGFKT